MRLVTQLVPSSIFYSNIQGLNNFYLYYNYQFVHTHTHKKTKFYTLLCLIEIVHQPCFPLSLNHKKPKLGWSFINHAYTYTHVCTQQQQLLLLLSSSLLLLFFFFLVQKSHQQDAIKYQKRKCTFGPNILASFLFWSLLFYFTAFSPQNEKCRLFWSLPLAH